MREILVYLEHGRIDVDSEVKSGDVHVPLIGHRTLAPKGAKGNIRWVFSLTLIDVIRSNTQDIGLIGWLPNLLL